MDYDYKTTEFSRSLMAGVFAGITACTLALIFNAFFRRYINFSLSAIINVSTIIFISILVVTIAGVVFYMFHHYLKQGTLIFRLAATLFTVLLIAGATQVQRSIDPVLSLDFKELLIGIICIVGLCTVVMIPMLYRRNLL